jgi:hypothetical protein
MIKMFDRSLCKIFHTKTVTLTDVLAEVSVIGLIGFFILSIITEAEKDFWGTAKKLGSFLGFAALVVIILLSDYVVIARCPSKEEVRKNIKN